MKDKIAQRERTEALVGGVKKTKKEDTENIKMVLLEKVNAKSKEETPPPKKKGRPKKYATPEDARKAKIEQTKTLNKAKRLVVPPMNIVGGGSTSELTTAFNNYGKIQEHLSHHLDDLKEAIDPKDLNDFIHFTKEKARLKEKIFGGRRMCALVLPSI